MMSTSQLLALVALGAPMILVAPANVARDSTFVTPTEARILIYISPVGERARAGGFDIDMELQTSTKLNQKDYYYFWVYDTKRPSSGSVTIGYYAVNKHTADVWDTGVPKELTSSVLAGVQAIIRRSHDIGPVTLRDYRDRPL